MNARKRTYCSANGITDDASEADANPPAEDEIERATAFLERFATPTRAINRAAGGSYHLKHVAQSWARAIGRWPNPYVSPGAFIVAAVRMGIRVKRKSATSRNVWLAARVRSPAPRKRCAECRQQLQSTYCAHRCADVKGT